MNFFRLLYREAGDSKRTFLLLSLVPGLVMGLIIAVINAVTNYQQNTGLQWQYLGLFVLGCATVLFTMNRALNMATAIIADYLCRLRIRVTAQVRSLNLATVEEIGLTRIRAAVGRDHQTIEETAPALVGLIYFVMQLVMSALYICYLSPLAFIVTLAFLAGAIFFYRKSYRDAEELMRQASLSEQAFHNSFENILSGFKEVKLNAQRSDDLFHNYIIPRSEQVEDLRVESGRSFNYGQSVSDVFFYTLMGTLVFAIPFYVSDLSIPGKIVTVIVFASGAITSIIRMLPVVSRANLAVSNIEELRDLLEKHSEAMDERSEVRQARLSKGISLKKIAYPYHSEDGDRPFSIGPCDLEIASGEMVFIVGGNGSGKSTLAKILTGLYEPDGGHLSWDDKVVKPENIDRYRSLFSVIFSDFHLFDRLYGVDLTDEQKLYDLLEDMKLDEKVHYRNNRFSTTNLSTGQRKRLAMVVALLEDRDVYLFDEWAADQDPEYRRWFYTDFLMKLKKEGRTVIAITHDDRYFDVADKIVWMEEGRISKVSSPADATV
ncbi:cyclic peptide export ABC transporter [Roseibium sp.]|uniref:cyclic peptide export ABC transporter n=1 Tax=Roseibium sp. TaxID=1936156 RepID=UPI003514079E